MKDTIMPIKKNAKHLII